MTNDATTISAATNSLSLVRAADVDSAGEGGEPVEWARQDRSVGERG
jgi:hypothetical protein